MFIHNFLCDLLLSIKVLFDSYIFPDRPNFIKHYEFNLGQRAFQLGPKPNLNYELPAAIVSINDENIIFGGRRSDLIQMTHHDNINKIPVLVNEEENLTLVVHEEQSAVVISVQVNCQSQLVAKELAHTLKRFLPPNKHLNIVQFVSFFEIPLQFLQEHMKINIFNNTKNLFTKMNQNTGDLEYCYALDYSPLIRLDSAITTVPDSSQSQFQVSIDFTYIIQFPIHLEVLEHHFIKTINFAWSDGYSTIIPSPRKYYLGLDPGYIVDRTLIIQSDVNSDLININTSEQKVIITLSFSKDDFIILPEHKFLFSKINPYSRIRKSKEFVPMFRYYTDNKMVFVIDISTSDEDYTTYLKPELTSPVFVDFYRDKPEEPEE
jgi:hypothetical protein